MSFNDIVGHDRQLEQIKNAIKKEKIPHAYLFSGPEGIGKKKVAEEFIKYLNCTNQNKEETLPCGTCPSCLRIDSHNQPDFFEISDQEGSIKIEQVRNLTSKLSLKNILTKYKCVIIDNCELITTEAANSLLKIIEEPGENVIFFLITSNENRLLPTIKSRTQKINFQQLSPVNLLKIAEEKGLTSENMEFLMAYSQGSFAKLRDLVGDQEFLEELKEYRELLKDIEEKPLFQIISKSKLFERDKKKLLRFLEFFIFILENEFGKNQSKEIKRIIEEIIKAQEMLLRNISARFVGEVLLIKTKSILKG